MKKLLVLLATATLVISSVSFAEGDAAATVGQATTSTQLQTQQDSQPNATDKAVKKSHRKHSCRHCNCQAKNTHTSNN